MKSFLLHIVRITTVLAIIISTTGFNVYMHHCNTSGETYSSVFISDNSEDVCNHELEKIVSCCTQKSECGINDDKCCTDFKRFIKADIDITIQKVKNHIGETPVVLLSDHINPNLFSTEVLAEEGCLQFGDKPPPLINKETLLTILNHRKIAPDPLISQYRI